MASKNNQDYIFSVPTPEKGSIAAFVDKLNTLSSPDGGRVILQTSDIRDGRFSVGLRSAPNKLQEKFLNKSGAVREELPDGGLTVAAAESSNLEDGIEPEPDSEGLILKTV